MIALQQRKTLTQNKSGAIHLFSFRTLTRLPGWRVLGAALTAFVGVGLGLSLGLGEANAGESEQADPAPKSQIVMLGTGTPKAESKRSGPSVAVVVAGTAYLVDFGPGVVRQAQAAYELGITALEPERLGFAFATHLHSDHTTGLADLVLAPWTLGRETDFELYGPPGIAAMAKHIIDAYQEDIEVRTHPLSYLPRTGWDINAHEVEPGIILTTPHLSIEAFPVTHGGWKHAFGYRFKMADRTIVISGDTRPSESLVAKAKGCDVLIHEAYLKKTFKKLDPNLRAYHDAGHTSGVDLGKLAAEVKPGLLIVYHPLLFGGTEDELLHEIKRGFSGQVVIGNDLDIY